MVGGAGIAFVGKGLGKLIQVVSQIVLARLLGMEDFGRLALGQTIIRFLGLIAPFGLPHAAVVFGAKYWRRDNERFRGVLFETTGIATIVGVLCAAGLAGGASWVSHTVFHDSVPPTVLRTLALAVPFVAALRVAVVLTQVSQRTQFAAIAEDIVQPTTVILVFACLFAFGGRLGAATTALTLSFAMSAGLALTFLRHLFPEALTGSVKAKSGLWDLLVFCMPTGLAVVCHIIAGMADRLIVGRYQSPEDIALYQAAGQISIAFTMILGSFTAIFAPMAARYIADREHEALGTLFRSTTKWGLYLALPVYLLLVAAPGTLLSVTFGSGYGGGASSLVILATAQLVNVGTGSVGVLLVSSGMQRSWLLLAVAAAILNTTIGIALVPTMGIVGAAIGNLVATTVLFGGGVLVAGLQLRLWAYERSMFKLLLAAGAAFGLQEATSFWLRSTGIWQLLSVGLVTVSTFYLALYLMGLDDGDRKMVAEVRNRLSRSAPP